VAETYDFHDLLAAYKAVGVQPGRLVYVTGNFGRPGHYHIAGKTPLLQAHLAALQELHGPGGTIVVPTHSWSLIRTDIVFDPDTTVSETGPFTEYVRLQKGSVRQFHPYSSHTALGHEARRICGDTSRHVFGLHSPFDRMIEADALYVAVGQEMERSISLVHHVELMMGVPYRYTKEFVHPCRVNGEIVQELFYVFVTHHDCDITRDGNRKIMKQFRHEYQVPRAPLGRSFIESVSTRDLYRSMSDLLRKDIYAWLAVPPQSRPYRT
jgi:aminoglycoside 3-N-acetyltransferase